MSLSVRICLYWRERRRAALEEGLLLLLWCAAAPPEEALVVLRVVGEAMMVGFCLGAKPTLVVFLLFLFLLCFLLLLLLLLLCSVGDVRREGGLELIQLRRAYRGW